MKKTYLAIAATALMAASAVAQADSSATSYNEVSNLLISVTPGISIGSSANNSSSLACMPNSNCASGGGAGVTDAAASQIGWAGYVQNSYLTNSDPGLSYVVADASIDSEQLLGDPFTQARAFTQGQLVTSATATGNARNSSATVVFDVGTAASLSFAFDADPYLRAFLSSNSIPNAQADANMSLSVNLYNSANALVFNWAPDGQAGNITGGSETRDPFSLNIGLTALVGNGGPLVYDPTGCTFGTAGGCFAATTNILAAGTYTLNLSMQQGINLVSSVSAVPEPETYGMLLSGLALLGFVARRKAKQV